MGHSRVWRTKLCVATSRAPLCAVPQGCPGFDRVRAAAPLLDARWLAAQRWGRWCLQLRGSCHWYGEIRQQLGRYLLLGLESTQQLAVLVV